MMDTSIYIGAFHPDDAFMERSYSGLARYKTRTKSPVKYYLIDFGPSRRYNDSVVHPHEIPILRGDKDFPEFQNSSEVCDPFATASVVYNLLRT